MCKIRSETWRRVHVVLPIFRFLGPLHTSGTVESTSNTFTKACRSSKDFLTLAKSVDKLVKWSQLNCLNINSNKTKEMVLGTLSKESVVPLTVSSTIVERVSV